MEGGKDGEFERKRDVWKIFKRLFWFHKMNWVTFYFFLFPREVYEK